MHELVIINKRIDMSSWILPIIGALIFFGAWCSAIAQSLEGKIVGVKDGDTIEMLIGTTPTTIRLDGIDCPEKSQAFGTQAKNFTSDRCFGMVCSVIASGKDRYGRTIGTIVTPTGLNLNRELVAAGLAWMYREYTSDRVLDSLESAAKAGQRGLWSDPKATPPWEYRKRSDSSKESQTETVQPTGSETYSGRCQATTKKGTQCKRSASPGSKYCWQHGG